MKRFATISASDGEAAAMFAKHYHYVELRMDMLKLNNEEIAEVIKQAELTIITHPESYYGTILLPADLMDKFIVDIPYGRLFNFMHQRNQLTEDNALWHTLNNLLINKRYRKMLSYHNTENEDPNAENILNSILNALNVWNIKPTIFEYIKIASRVKTMNALTNLLKILHTQKEDTKGRIAVIPITNNITNARQTAVQQGSALMYYYADEPVIDGQTYIGNEITN